MEETIDKEIPKGKVFKNKTFWVGPFLGGPLAAGYLFSENFKTLGQPEKVKTTWVYTIIATVIIFGSIFMIPDSIDVPNHIIPIIYSAIAYGLFMKYQDKEVNNHIEAGGLIQSWWKVIGVGLIGISITILPIFAIAYAQGDFDELDITTKTYGPTDMHEISYEAINISEKEVDMIAEGFKETGFFDYSVGKYVYVKKNENKYEIFISVIEGIENDNVALQPFIELRYLMDEYLPNNTVEIKLTVEYIDNVVKVLK